MATTSSARFEARLPLKQKALIEKAAALGGFRTLSDFVIQTAIARAEDIISEKDRILANEKDAEIFFDALTKPKKPNRALVDAMKEYKKALSR